MATVRTTAFPIDKCVPGDLVIRKGLADEVCIIDESNAEDYTMEDVVLPLIGYDSILPANAVGEKARELLQADGIKQSMFNHRVKYVDEKAATHCIGNSPCLGRIVVCW